MTQTPTTLYADDLQPGQRIPLGEYTLEEDEILAFARQWDPLFIHADPVAAAASPLGGIVASGLQTLAVYQRLVVAALWSRLAGGIGRGFEIRFRRPVRPGTRLTGHVTIRSVAPRPERGDALVALAAELVDGQGEVVMDLVNESVLPLRSADGEPATRRSSPS